MENKTRFIKAKKSFRVEGNKYAPEQTRLYINGVDIPLSTPQRQALCRCNSVEECKRFVRSHIFAQPKEYSKHAIIKGYHTLERLEQYNGKIIGNGTFKAYNQVLSVVNNFKGKNTDCKLIVDFTADNKPIYKDFKNSPYCKVTLQSQWI